MLEFRSLVGIGRSQNFHMVPSYDQTTYEFLNYYIHEYSRLSVIFRSMLTYFHITRASVSVPGVFANLSSSLGHGPWCSKGIVVRMLFGFI